MTPHRTGPETSESRRPAGPTRREVVAGVTRELELAGLESPELEARRLVAAALGIEPAEITVGGSTRVAPSAAVEVARAVGRRLEGEPLQHIEGTSEFRALRLVTDGRALIPRPETEQLIDHVDAWVDERGGPAENGLDIGTGSGALGLALLDEGLARRVLALELSPAARELAAENARDAEAFEIRACGSDIWSALEPGELFDLIVSNPPYVASEEWESLDPLVRDNEPRVALDGGADGLDVIRAILVGAAQVLSPAGALFLEIGAGQGAAVLGLLRATPGLGEARIEPDLAGRDRFAVAVRTP